MSFFCGHDDVCNTVFSREALARAMKNVEERYAVVGVTEMFDKSLEVLEAYIPRYFAGAKAMYHNRVKFAFHQNKNIYKRKPVPEVRQLLKANFTVEYEFYEFCKQRLEKQHALLRL